MPHITSIHSGTASTSEAFLGTVLSSISTANTLQNSVVQKSLSTFKIPYFGVKCDEPETIHEDFSLLRSRCHIVDK